MEEIKPGYQTSEFWLTALVCAVLSAFGLCADCSGHTVAECVTKGCTVCAAFGTVAFAVWRYIKARIKLKAGETDVHVHIPIDDEDKTGDGPREMILTD